MDGSLPTHGDGIKHTRTHPRTVASLATHSRVPSVTVVGTGRVGYLQALPNCKIN